MIKGFRLEAQTDRERTSRTVKPVLEYTAGDILSKGVSWMTDKAPNADMLTREGDDFDKALKSVKKMMTIAIPEKWLMGHLTEKQYLQEFMIRWYSDQSKGVDDYWRLIIFHHVTIKRVTLRDFRSAGMLNASYYEVVMKIDADVEYMDKFGSKAQ